MLTLDSRSDGSRISRTAEAPTPKVEASTYYLAKFSLKLHENERNCTGGGGVPGTPHHLRSANGLVPFFPPIQLWLDEAIVCRDIGYRLACVAVLQTNHCNTGPTNPIFNSSLKFKHLMMVMLFRTTSIKINKIQVSQRPLHVLSLLLFFYSRTLEVRIVS